MGTHTNTGAHTQEYEPESSDDADFSDEDDEQWSWRHHHEVGQADQHPPRPKEGPDHLLEVREQLRSSKQTVSLNNCACERAGGKA